MILIPFGDNLFVFCLKHAHIDFLYITYPSPGLNVVDQQTRGIDRLLFVVLLSWRLNPSTGKKRRASLSDLVYF